MKLSIKNLSLNLQFGLIFFIMITSILGCGVGSHSDAPKRYWSKQVVQLSDAVDAAQYSAKVWNDSLQVAKRMAPIKYAEVYKLLRSKGMDTAQASGLAKKLSSVSVDYWEQAVQTTEIKLREKRLKLKAAKEMLRKIN